MKKLQSRNGETLLETLLSVLIVGVTFMFLSISVVTAGKINRKSTDTDSGLHAVNSDGTGAYSSVAAGNAAIKVNGAAADSVSVIVYQTSDGRYSFYMPVS